MATKLYVGNLNFRTNDDVLGQAFEAAGLTVVSAKVIIDRETGRSRGFAFVDVDPKHAIEDVLRLMHGRDVEGRPLNVTEARERDRPPMGGPRMGPRIGPPVNAQRPPQGHRPEFSHEAPYRPARPVHDFARPPMGGGGHMPPPADLMGTDANDGRNRDSRRERREFKGSRQQERDDDDDDDY